MPGLGQLDAAALAGATIAVAGGPAVRLGEHSVATLYSIPLPGTPTIESLVLQAVSNESVIGLMACTLLEP